MPLPPPAARQSPPPEIGCDPVTAPLWPDPLGRSPHVSHGSRFPWLRRVLQAVATRGVRVTARLLLRSAATRLQLRPPPATPSSLDPYPRSVPEAIHPFDLRHNVETSGFVRGEDLARRPPRQRRRLLGAGVWNTAYYAIAPSVFDRALALLSPPQHPVDWSRFTFADLGCGKGRALLLAARYPFRHILGVELDPALASIAQANLRSFSAAWQQCHNLEVRLADATAIDLPPSPLVLYLYHPFLAPALLRVLARLEDSLRQHPRELWLLYLNPEADAVLRRFPWLREQARATLRITAEDALADRFGSDQEELALFHVSAPDPEVP